MKPNHRSIALAAALVAASWAVPQSRAAEPAYRAYPAKPVRIIVPTSPSGGTDYSARMFAQKLNDAWGQTVVVDNRPGATGTIGMSLAAHATPDGYTLVVVNVGHLINALLAPDPGFDPMKDLVPISLLAKTPVILVVHPSLNVRTLQEFIALAKAKPGKLLYASGGTAGVQHVSTELLKQEAHIDLVHVPYKGTGPGLIDLLAGQVQLTMTSVPSVLPHVQAGKLRALAVTGDHRVAAAPDVPTFAESGLPGVSMVIWYGLMAPAHTPVAIVEKVARSAANAARVPDLREKMSRGGADPVGDTPAQFGAYYKAEGAKWLAVARKADIRLDARR